MALTVNMQSNGQLFPASRVGHPTHIRPRVRLGRVQNHQRSVIGHVIVVAQGGEGLAVFDPLDDGWGHAQGGAIHGDRVGVDDLVPGVCTCDGWWNYGG